MHKTLTYMCTKLCKYTASACLEKKHLNLTKLTLRKYGVNRPFYGQVQIICLS